MDAQLLAFFAAHLLIFTILNGMGTNVISTVGVDAGQGNANASITLNNSQVNVDNELTNVGTSSSTNYVSGVFADLNGNASLTVNMNNGSITGSATNFNVDVPFKPVNP